MGDEGGPGAPHRGRPPGDAQTQRSATPCSDRKRLAASPRRGVGGLWEKQFRPGTGLGLLPGSAGPVHLPVPGRRGWEASPENQLLLPTGGAVRPRLRLSLIRVDVTEIQVALVIIFILSAFGGATMWDYTIPMLEIRLKIFPVLGVVGGAIFSCSNYFHVILHGGVGKNGSTVAGTSVLSPGLHIGLTIVLAVMIYKKSAANVFEKHPCLYTLMFGCVFAKVAQKLVIAHMTKSELYLQDTIFIGPGLLFLDQYFNNFVDEYVVLWIAMVVASLDMILYFSALCLQISRHLHQSIFKISCHQAPEQVHVLSPKSHQSNMD